MGQTKTFNKEMLNLFLSKGASMNIKNKKGGNTPLHISQNNQLTKQLLQMEEKVEREIKNDEGMNFIETQSKNFDLEIFSFFVEQKILKKTDFEKTISVFNENNKKKENILHKICKSLEYSPLLLESFLPFLKDEKLFIEKNEEKLNPLEISIKNDNVKKKTKKKKKNLYFLHFFFFPITKVSAVSLLLPFYSSSKNSTDYFKFCVSCSAFGCLLLLVVDGFQIEKSLLLQYRDDDGNSILHKFVSMKSVEGVSVLMQHGIDVNIENKKIDSFIGKETKKLKKNIIIFFFF